MVSHWFYNLYKRGRDRTFSTLRQCYGITCNIILIIDKIDTFSLRSKKLNATNLTVIMYAAHFCFFSGSPQIETALLQIENALPK